MAEYLKRDIARILRKRPGTIEFYTTSGLVVPDIEPSQGKGVPRVFSGRNLMEFGMIAIMSKMGIPLSTIKCVLDILRKGEWDPLQEGYEPDTDIEKASFKDFYTSDEWGSEKELFFIRSIDLSDPNNLEEDYWIKVQDSPKHEFFEVTPGLETILWLGRIKKAAVRLVLG